MKRLKLRNLTRLYRTLRPLKAEQVGYRLLHITRGKFERTLPAWLRYRYAVDPGGVHVRSGFPAALRRRLEAACSPAADEQAACRERWAGLQGGQISFLNAAASFEALPDWHPADRDRLWQLNLHYFEYATEVAWLVALEGQAYEDAAAWLKSLILDWVESNPVGSAEGWDAYAISLRVVNWMKVYALCGSALQDDAGFRSIFLGSLYQQVHYLRRHVEFHIQANHLFENFRALALAGLFFSTPEAEQWRAYAVPRLLDELEEETLADGGHYERSPAYHCTVLDHVLDVVLFDTCVDRAPSPVETYGRRMGSFLAAFPHTAYLFPHYNDSGANICPRPGAILRRLAALGLSVDPAESMSVLVDDGTVRAYALVASGYYVVERGPWLFIIDGGELGPAYQPSHAHCDVFSFWLYHDRVPIVVEAGTYGYYNDAEMRAYCRSTRGHNAVMIDGYEQAEVWHNFRLGRRPAPVVQQWSYGGGCITWQGEHDGYDYVDAGLRVRRCISIDLRNGFEMSCEDAWRGGNKPHTMQGFIHIAPGLGVEAEGNTAAVDGAHPLAVTLETGRRWGLEQGWFCPAFGVRHASTVLTYEARERVQWVLSDRVPGISRRKRGAPLNASFAGSPPTYSPPS